MKKLLYISILLLFSCVLKATNYYVATTGDNGDPGTIGEPWATLTYAMSSSSGVGPGDTVYIKAGDYSPEEVDITISGTESQRITVLGYKTTPGDAKDDWTYGDSHDSAEMPYYDGDNGGNGIDFNNEEFITIKNIQLTEHLYGVRMDGGHNIIENFFVTECGDKASNNGYGIYLFGSKVYLNGTLYGYDADSCKVMNCVVINSTLTNIATFSSYDTIINCESYCDDNSTGVNSATDYYISNVGQKNNVIKDCYAYRIGDLGHSGHGIGIKGSWVGSSNPGGGVDCENHRIEGCTVRNMKNEGFWIAHHNAINNVIDSCHAIKGEDGYVLRDSANNNTLTDCSADSMDYSSTSSAITFRDGTEDLEGYTSVSNTFTRFLITNSSGVIFFDYGDDNVGGTWSVEANDNIFRHFTIYNCDYLFTYLRSDNADNEFINSIVLDVTDDYYSEVETDNTTYTYCDFYNGFTAFAGTGNITDNPNLTDPGGYDFTLQTGSPCIDAGTDVGLTYYGDAPDMGAFESGEVEPPVTHPRSLSTNGRGSFRKSGGRFIKQ